MVRYPVAGMMFVYFNYVLGLRRLGHEVLYLEESGWDRSCYDPTAGDYGDDPTTGLRSVRDLFSRFGLEEVAIAYVRHDSRQSWGLPWNEIERRIRDADLILNVGGVCWMDEFLEIEARVLIDLDPLFTQAGAFGYERLNHYTLHFTYGINTGRGGCTIPTHGLRWYPIQPPVAPELWESGARELSRREPVFTTIANWQAYGGIEFQGERFGQKDEEFRRFEPVARRSGAYLEIAVDNMPEHDRQRFIRSGWRVVSGARVSRSIDTYRAYIQQSAGEFSVAKNAYVKSNSGWFSDRSVCYLACGLPVIVQETGFSEQVETGRGVLTFRTVEEACDCLERVRKDYDTHSRAALRMVARNFHYRVVLPAMLEIAL
jgi:hypothetical protein